MANDYAKKSELGNSELLKDNLQQTIQDIEVVAQNESTRVNTITMDDAIGNKITDANTYISEHTTFNVDDELIVIANDASTLSDVGQSITDNNDKYTYGVEVIQNIKGFERDGRKQYIGSYNGLPFIITDNGDNDIYLKSTIFETFEPTLKFDMNYLYIESVNNVQILNCTPIDIDPMTLTSCPKLNMIINDNRFISPINVSIHDLLVSFTEFNEYKVILADDNGMILPDGTYTKRTTPLDLLNVTTSNSLHSTIRDEVITTAKRFIKYDSYMGRVFKYNGSLIKEGTESWES